jgi:hypothetical protein
MSSPASTPQPRFDSAPAASLAPAPAPSTLLQKLGAAAIHLALSAVATGTLAAAMWFALYPTPYFWIDGGWRVLRILLLADLVLGPALTFVVYNRAKREWKRDLAIIAIVQIVAFAYGAYTMARYRPVFAAYVDDTFFAVTWPRVEAATPNLDKARALRAGQWAPTFVVVDMPADKKAAQELRLRANPDGNRSLPGMADRYVPFTGEVAQKIFANGADVAALARGDKQIAAEYARVQAEHPGPITRYSFLPLAGRDDVTLLMFDKQTGQMVDWMR